MRYYGHVVNLSANLVEELLKIILSHKFLSNPSRVRAQSDMERSASSLRLAKSALQ